VLIAVMFVLVPGALVFGGWGYVQPPFIPGGMDVTLHGTSVGFYNVWFGVAELTVRARVLVGVLGAATLAAMFLCIYHLDRLLAEFSRGEVFSRESAKQVRQVGIAYILCGVMKIVWPLVGYALEPRRWTGTVQLEGDLVVIGVAVFLASWFMAMAAEMREEQELIV
jgi:hypothetical protein